MAMALLLGGDDFQQALTIATSDQFRFDYNQLAVRFVSRFAVNVHGDGRGSTYGPITAIKTS